MALDKGVWGRFAKAYQAETSTAEFKRKQRLARIQGAMMLMLTLVIVGPFWVLKWPPRIAAVLVAVGFMAVRLLAPRLIK